MNQTMMVSNLVILSNNLNEGNIPDDLPFPHAWAAVIWFAVTILVVLIALIPYAEWDYKIDRYPTTENQREHNAKYKRRIRIMFIVAAMISVLGAIIPLCMGL